MVSLFTKFYSCIAQTDPDQGLVSCAKLWDLLNGKQNHMPFSENHDDPNATHVRFSPVDFKLVDPTNPLVNFSVHQRVQNFEVGHVSLTTAMAFCAFLFMTKKWGPCIRGP